MEGEGKMNGEIQVCNSEEENIVVSVRLRPFNEKELARDERSDWECISNNTIAITNNLSDRTMFPTAYTFDRVFGFDCPTKQVYEEGAKEVILSVVSGINSTIFAYGQTSSGKTYTMNGITEYAIADICSYIEMHKDREFVLKFSAMEIYNEAVRDLLSLDSTPLRLLDDPIKGTVVEKLIEEVLRDQNHLQELLSTCEAQRRIGETSLNETSSRSHQILRLTIESSARKFQGIGSSRALAASVNFVDLAGSERASQTLSAGARLKEGSHINRSLLTLGTVIRKLSKGRNGHIPYRDSKLTRILQNSLGGNARTAIICTLNPARSHVEQSRNTLFFASCAKEVTNNAKINVVMSDKALVKQLQRELAKMENELKTLTSKPVSDDSAELLKEKEFLIEQMDKEIKELRKQRDLAESRIESMIQSVGEGVSRSDECLGSELTSGIIVDEDTRSNSSNHRRKLLENSEDSFSTPKLVELGPSQGWEEMAQETDAKPADDDICKEVQRIEANESRMDLKRESDVVRPVPEEKEGNSTITVPSSQNEEKGLSLIDPSCSYDALKQKILEMQRTINCLVSFYPSELSPCSSEANMSSARSFKSTRSRSCKAVLTSTPSSVWLKETDQNENPSFEHSFWWKTSRSNLGVNIENLSRKDSHSSTMSSSYGRETVEDFPGRLNGFKQDLSRLNHGIHVRKSSSNDSRDSVLSSPLGSEQNKDIDVDYTFEDSSRREKGLQRKLFKSKYGSKTGKIHRKLSAAARYYPIESDSDDTVSVLNFVAEHNEAAKPQYESQYSNNLEQEAAPEKLRDNEEHASLDALWGPPPNLSWSSQFERQRREIIELWDACNVPLLHRTYFFLLFKGEPSDSVYLEVELRRLSFLKDTFSLKRNLKKDSHIATPSSSMKMINREREMLSKQVHKKFAAKDREKLYQKWGIKLNSKRRSLQLARRLWTNTKDIDHLRQSAILVDKLVGFVEPGRVPKEMFGLSFLPQTAQPINRKKSFV